MFEGRVDNKVHITGYNNKSVDAYSEKDLFGRSDPRGKILKSKLQPLYKKLQKQMYATAAHADGDIIDPKDMVKLLKKRKEKGSKTFHVVGSEDYYNKNFSPDPDDLALTSKKKVKAAPSKFKGLINAVKREGLAGGLKSSPKSRIAIGAGLLTGGAIATKKLTDPLRERLFSKKAAGPPVLNKVLPNDVAGWYVQPKTKGGKGIIELNVRKNPSRETLRHELTHYLNNQKGKYQKTNVKSPGGVKDTFLNEVSAYRSQRPKHLRPKNPLVRMGREIDDLKRAGRSTSRAYKGKALKTLFKFL